MATSEWTEKHPRINSNCITRLRYAQTTAPQTEISIYKPWLWIKNSNKNPILHNYTSSCGLMNRKLWYTIRARKNRARQMNEISSFSLNTYLLRVLYIYTHWQVNKRFVWCGKRALGVTKWKYAMWMPVPVSLSLTFFIFSYFFFTVPPFFFSLFEMQRLSGTCTCNTMHNILLVILVSFSLKTVHIYIVRIFARCQLHCCHYVWSSILFLNQDSGVLFLLLLAIFFFYLYVHTSIFNLPYA